MEESGMTDLQFKSWIRAIIALLKAAEEQDTLEKMREKIGELIEEFQVDLQG